MNLIKDKIPILKVFAHPNLIKEKQTLKWFNTCFEDFFKDQNELTHYNILKCLRKLCEYHDKDGVISVE